MTTIYFAGGEDSEWSGMGPTAITTTAGSYRSSYARCGLATNSNSSPNFSGFWQTTNPIATIPNPCWFSHQWDVIFSNTGAGPSTNPATGFYDSGGIARVALRPFSQPVAGQMAWQVIKQNAAGTITQLGSNFNFPYAIVHTLMKVDIFVNYAVSGAVQVYVNGVQVFNFSGDVTTDSLTNMNGFYLRMGGPVQNPNYSGQWAFSEAILADTDTRGWTLQTLAPVANGNTHNFDTGSPAASNVNETTLNDATLDGSSVAGQIDQYTLPSLAAGTWSVIALGISSRMAKGASGPSKMDLGVRSAGADYWSSDFTLTTGYQDFQYWQSVDPATSAAWTGLPTNIGLKSVT
jgi:hypothetical protein